MNRLIHLLFPVALGLASGAAADLVASLARISMRCSAI